MNFKRKTICRGRFKSKLLNSNKVSRWMYGRGIAKEVLYRKEFREYKKNLIK